MESLGSSRGALPNYNFIINAALYRAVASLNIEEVERITSQYWRVINPSVKEYEFSVWEILDFSTKHTKDLLGRISSQHLGYDRAQLELDLAKQQQIFALLRKNFQYTH